MAETTGTCKWESATPYNCKPGYCVIINNMVFDSEDFLPLHDSKFDEECLKEVFTTLGFTVKSHQNLKRIDIISKVKEYAGMEHEGRALFVIILSHGGEGNVVFGTDGGEVKLHRLQEYFSAANCRSLAGVPKAFLIDAGQDNGTEKGYWYNVAKAQPYSMESCDSIITNSSDFITVFASTSGSAAYMYNGSEKKGSYFTQTLVEVIKEADENKEFNEILREVRHRIIQAAAQTVEGTSTLTKPYYIKRFGKKDEIN